jgi:hypothetical protein
LFCFSLLIVHNLGNVDFAAEAGQKAVVLGVEWRGGSKVSLVKSYWGLAKKSIDFLLLFVNFAKFVCVERSCIDGHSNARCGRQPDLCTLASVGKVF